MQEPTIFSLENDQLSAKVSSKGAELQSVVHDGLERMWCADATVWGRHAPLLFPLIGRLREGWYTHEGRRIEAPTHGFCRDRTFAARQLSSTQVCFETKADETTRAVYPFDFRLSVRFALKGNAIEKTHVVENCGDCPMPFEVGGHEAYATRLMPGESMSDYVVRFEGLDEIEMFGMDEAGTMTLPKIAVPLEDGCLTKTPEQLGIDTVVIENVPNSAATLECVKTGRGVRVEFPGFPYVGIWTKAGQDDVCYLCIEPWSALPDAHFSPRELAEKPGVIALAPGESVSLVYRMTFR